MDSKLMLGKLCTVPGHEYEDSGKTLIYRASKICSLCAAAKVTKPRHKMFSEKSVYDLAIERVVEAYSRFDRVVVSFSGGKDSTVALHVTIEAARKLGKLPVEAYFWDEEAIYPKTVEYVTRIAANPDVRLRWLAVPHKHRNACSRKEPWWYPWDPEKKDLWVRQPPEWAERELPGYTDWVAMPETNRFVYPNKGETVGIVNGIRAQESLRRFMVVTRKTVDNWISYDGTAPWCASLKPIYDWGVADVWTAPQMFGWDYNRVYDDFERIGISRQAQRVCPPFGEEPLQGLYAYATLAPEIWEPMTTRVKGARTAARYSRSPLYGVGKGASEELGTFQDQIKHELDKWPEPERTQIAFRIKREIELWNHRTRFAPIPAVSENLDGFSWAFLLQVVRRGDFKNRKKATSHSEK